MSFGLSTTKATQAASASCDSPLSASADLQINLENNTEVSDPLRNAHNNTETLSLYKQNETALSEHSDDTIIAVFDAHESTMGNRQCAGKEHSSKSENKEEEGDIWIKRDDSKQRAKEKREEKRKKKKQKNIDINNEQNNKGCSTKVSVKSHGNGIEQDQCLSNTHGAVEVEVDRWAGVKMVDDFSSSSTGYHTPEVKTPQLHRTDKVRQPELNRKVKIETKIEGSEKGPGSKTLPLTSKVVTKSEKEPVSKTLPLTSKVITKSEYKVGDNSKNVTTALSKEVTKNKNLVTTKTITLPSNEQSVEFIPEKEDIITKNEALARLDSLSNSPRSQRRHALLLSNEVAKYIPLPADKEKQNTTNFQSYSVARPNVMEIKQAPVVKYNAEQNTESHRTFLKEVDNNISNKEMTDEISSKNLPLIQLVDSKKSENNSISDSNKFEENKSLKNDTNVKSPVKIIEPSDDTGIFDNENGVSVTRSSTIEIMEDNRANELREATAETFESIPGPGVAIMACIPPPEKALITHVPPPSPSSIEILEEEDEEDENCEIESESSRKSKEMETFSDTVCQRLSLLLETKELTEETIEDEVSPASSLDILLDNKSDLSYGTDSDSDSSDDEYDENDYVQESDSFNDYSDDNIDDIGIDMPQKKKNNLDIQLVVARTPSGKNDASPLDLMNNNFSVQNAKGESALQPISDEVTEQRIEPMESSSVFQYEKMNVHELSRRSAVDDSFQSSTESEDSDQLNRTRNNDKIFNRKKYKNKKDDASLKLPTVSAFDDGISNKDIALSNLMSAKRQSENNPNNIHREKLTDHNQKDYTHDQVNSDGTSCDTSNAPKRSRLDESLKAIFKMPNTEENYSEMESLQHWLELDCDVTPTSDKLAAFDADDAHIAQTSGRRKSFGCTESSDLDVSEHRDDLSTDSMLADDEDEGEVLFSRTYPEPSGAEVLISCTVVNSAVQYDNSDEFWDADIPDDTEDEPDLRAEQDIFASDAYVDSDFDNARKQMQDIHTHLKNLKHQMNNLHDDLGAGACAPESSSDYSEPVGNRRALTD